MAPEATLERAAVTAPVLETVPPLTGAPAATEQLATA